MEWLGQRPFEVAIRVLQKYQEMPKKTSSFEYSTVVVLNNSGSLLFIFCISVVCLTNECSRDRLVGPQTQTCLCVTHLLNFFHIFDRKAQN